MPLALTEIKASYCEYDSATLCVTATSSEGTVPGIFRFAALKQLSDQCLVNYHFNPANTDTCNGNWCGDMCCNSGSGGSTHGFESTELRSSFCCLLCCVCLVAFLLLFVFVLAAFVCLHVFLVVCYCSCCCLLFVVCYCYRCLLLLSLFVCDCFIHFFSSSFFLAVANHRLRQHKTTTWMISVKTILNSVVIS